MRYPKVLFILFLIWTDVSYCQNITKTAQELNAIIRPILSFSSEDSFEDLNSLKAVAKDVSIIGIGESTHGTSFYTLYRQRLVRFLVEEMSFTAIIDEGDILAAEKVDDYINGKADSLVLDGGLRPVVTNRKELDWLREYNSSRSEHQRVHIYGAEIRGFYGIIQKIKTQFPNVATDIIKKFEGDVGVNYSNLTKADFEDISKFSQKIKEEVNNQRQNYYSLLLDQVIDFAYRQRFGRNGFGARDQYMFENIKRIVENTSTSKAIVLAHNGHLQKTKFTTLTSLGFLLNKYFRNKYFVAATDFNSGNVNVYDSKSRGYVYKYFDKVEDRRSVEYALGQCQYPEFFLLIKDALNNNATSSFVNARLKMLRNIGSHGDIIKSPIRIAENFDLLIFINNTDNVDSNKSDTGKK